MTLRDNGTSRLTVSQEALVELTGDLGSIRGSLTQSLCRGQKNTLIDTVHSISMKLAYLYLSVPGVRLRGGTHKRVAAGLFNLAGILYPLSKAGTVISSNTVFKPKKLSFIGARVTGYALGVGEGGILRWRKRIEIALLAHYQNFNYDLFIQECRQKVKGPKPIWYGFGSQEQATEFYTHFLELLDKEKIPPSKGMLQDSDRA